MSALAFKIPGEARGKGRPRAAVRGGHARIYTDPKTRAYETVVQMAALSAMAGAPPLEGPLAVALVVWLPVPQSYSKKRRAAILSGVEPYFGAYDADNLAKAILDGCNGVCWADDKQITHLRVTKRPGEQPGADVLIQPYRVEVTCQA